MADQWIYCQAHHVTALNAALQNSCPFFKLSIEYFFMKFSENTLEKAKKAARIFLQFTKKEKYGKDLPSGKISYRFF